MANQPRWKLNQKLSLYSRPLVHLLVLEVVDTPSPSLESPQRKRENTGKGNVMGTSPELSRRASANQTSPLGISGHRSCNQAWLLVLHLSKEGRKWWRSPQSKHHRIEVWDVRWGASTSWKESMPVLENQTLVGDGWNTKEKDGWNGCHSLPCWWGLVSPGMLTLGFQLSCCCCLLP